MYSLPKWFAAMLLVSVVASVAHANNVTDTLVAGQSPSTGDILWYSGVSGNTSGTWSQPSSIPGLAGLDGTNGINGVDGAKGDTGATGANGKDGKNGINGRDGHDAQAPAIDPRLDVEVREYDAKHWSLSSFASFGMQSSTSRYIVGQKLTLKLGKSYEQKQMEAMEQRMSKLLKDSVFLGD